jgi:hypothetical protein
MKVKELYNKNYRTPKKEIEEDTRRWKNLPCSWISKINSIKMAILIKTIYRFNEMLIRIPMSCFPEIEIS